MSGQKFQMVKVDDVVYAGAEVEDVSWVDCPEAMVIVLKDGRVIETTHPVTVIRLPEVTP